MENIVFTRHQLRPSDIDIWGHLNHSKAVELFELGRFAWVSRNRFPLDREWVPVVTRIDVVYRREVFISEIVIKTEMVEAKHYSAGFEQAILASDTDSDPAVAGRVWLSFLNKATRRPTRLRDLDAWLPRVRQKARRETSRDTVMAPV